MTWLYEDPWTVLLVCIAIGVSVQIVCSQLSQHAMLLGAIGTLVFSALLFGIEWYVVTDHEQVENTLYGAAEAVGSGDFSNVRPFLVKRTLPVEGQARGWVERYRVKRVKLTDIKIEFNSPLNPVEANVELWAHVDFDESAQAATIYGSVHPHVTLKLEKEENQWRISDAKVHQRQ